MTETETSQEGTPQSVPDARSAIRNHILPIFKDLGFQRVTQSVCERWDGGSPERPDRFLRLHLVRRPAWLGVPNLSAFGVELSISHPPLEHTECSTRLDGKGRYSPKLAEVSRSRHNLVLWSDDGQPEWEAPQRAIEPMFQKMAKGIGEKLVPAIRALGDFEQEIDSFRSSAALTPEAVRKRVSEEHSRREANEDCNSQWQLHWSTRARPAYFFCKDLKKPARPEDWRDPFVSALISQSHSLHYVAALAKRFASQSNDEDFRLKAVEMERATGVALVSDTIVDLLAASGR